MRRFAALFLATALLCAAAFALFEASLLRWGLMRMADATGLVVEEVAVLPDGGLRIGRLVWHSGGDGAAITPGAVRPGASTLTMVGLRVGLDRWRLLRGEIALSRLAIDRLTFIAAGATGDMPLPPDLRLPVRLSVPDVRIGALGLGVAGSGTLELGPVDLSFAYTPGTYRIGRFRFTADWGAGSFNGELADAAPFALRADGQVALAPFGLLRALTLDLRAAGTLGELAVDATLGPRTAQPSQPSQPAADGDGPPGGSLIARTRLRPFAAYPWESLTMRLGSLDLSAWIDGVVPRTALTGDLDLMPRPAAGTGATPAFDAQARLRNLSGPAPDGLPVTALEASLRWRDDRLRVEGISVDLRGGGTIAGAVSLDAVGLASATDLPGRLSTIDLRFQGVDPSTVAPALTAALSAASLPQARFDGRLHGESGRLDLDLRASGSVAALRLRTRFVDGRLGVEQARLDAGPAGRLQASGTVQLSPPWAVSLHGDFAGVDPARLRWPGVSAALTGRWSIDGAVGALLSDAANVPPLSLMLSVDEGRTGAGRLTGRVDAMLSRTRLSGVKLVANLGPVALQASGALGESDDSLDFALRAPTLAPLGALVGTPDIAGALSLDGALRGALAAPALSLRGQLSDLGAGAMFARTVSLSLDLPQLRERIDAAPLRLKVDAQQLRVGQMPVQRLFVEVDGQAAAHTLEAGIDGQRMSTRLRGTGALQAGPHWSIAVSSLTNQGALPLRMTAPLAIDWQPGALRISGLSLDSPFGTLRAARLAWVDGQGEARVDASLATLGGLAAALGLPSGNDTADARLDALRLQLAVDVSGAGWRTLSGRVEAGLRGTTPGAGGGDLDLVLRDGALAGRLALRVPTLAFANRLIGPEWSIDGRLAFAGRVGGSLREPLLDGVVEGADLKLEQRALGWRLDSGALAARFDGDRLQVDALTLRSAAKGAGGIHLSGVAQASGDGRFVLRADRLAVPIGAGQRLVVSGEAQMVGRAGALELRGRLRADEGRIDLAGGDVPTMPADLVIVGPEGGVARRAGPFVSDAANGTSEAAASPSSSGATASPRRGSPAQLALSADLSVDLGDALRVQGAGVDARLGGTINLRGMLPQAPRAFGTVLVREGAYMAYGRRLDIVRGALVFNGALDNPALDMLALRRDLPVEAGVSLTGSVLSPRVRLASRPDVPDSEKLSWLVLGVPLDGVRSAGQGAALQAAAATLFGRNDGSLTGNLARAIGLDVLTIRGASAGGEGLLPSGFGGGFGVALPPVPGQAGAAHAAAGAGAFADNVVALGKRLGPGLTVSYEQGLRGVWNLLRIQYDITRRLSIRAQTGTESALDLLYRIAFD